ncbi:MAG: AMP-dependent synthetase [Rhodobacteraceae bacterium]|nr:AMP-dependent synthetase [Paracoccaceae bacterium]MAY47483.1 AMP-dependent synthetase [Paracoccaceae bacterium]
MNPAEWLVRSAAAGPDRPALLRGTEVVADYAGFARGAGAVAAALLSHGVKPGDRVALFAKNATDYLVAMYGIWWLGGVAVPINAKLHDREAAYIVTHSGAAALLTEPAHRDALQALCPDPLILDLATLVAHATGPAPDIHEMDAGDLAWLFYTSGTTGQPKGVMLSTGNLEAMTLAYFADVDPVSGADAALYAAPMSHGAGLYNFMHVIKGARHVVPASGGFDGAEVLALGRALDNLSMFAAPTMVRRLVDAAKAEGSRGEGIRTIVYGGGPMYTADIAEALQVMGPRFVQIYGQGECPMAITALSRDEIAGAGLAMLGSVGRAQSPVRVRIADADGRSLPPGEVGEILVRGTPVMAGYWQDTAATAKTLKGGWLCTGDMGSLDDAGYLTLRDRSKDVIISGGTNIYPREVEEALLTHPGVSEVSVIGRPDPEWGEVVVACVVAHGAPPDPADLDAHCLDSIARFKRPKAYVFLPELPKNNYGKVLKTDLRARDRTDA